MFMEKLLHVSICLETWQLIGSKKIYVIDSKTGTIHINFEKVDLAGVLLKLLSRLL